MQKSPGLKPGWITEIKPLSWEKTNISLYKNLSNFLLKIGTKDTGQ